MDKKKKDSDQYEKIVSNEITDKFVLRGKYPLNVTDVENNRESGTCTIKWQYDNKKKNATDRHQLHLDLLHFLYRETNKRNLCSCDVEGYTELKTLFEDVDIVFLASPWYMGGYWYD